MSTKLRSPETLLAYAYSLHEKDPSENGQVRIYEEAFNHLSQWPEIGDSAFCTELDKVFHEKYLGGLMFSGPCDLDAWVLTITFAGVKPVEEIKKEPIKLITEQSLIDAVCRYLPSQAYAKQAAISVAQNIWRLLK